MPNLHPSKEAMLAERAKKIWKLRVRGWTQDRIAEHLEIDQAIVCRSIQNSLKKYTENFQANIHTYKMQQAAVIEEAAQSTLEQYYRSQEDFLKTIQTGKRGKDGKKLERPLTTLEKSKQYGDTKLLAAYFKCVEELNKIWGIPNEVKAPQNQFGNLSVEEKITMFTSMPIEERLKMLAAMVTNKQSQPPAENPAQQKNLGDDLTGNENFE